MGGGGAPAFGVGPAGAELGAQGTVSEILQVELLAFADHVGPVGADDDAVHVRGDEQGRVFEGAGVAQELVVGLFEVVAAGLVFPAEAAAFPDIGPAAAAGGFLDAFFEGVGGAGGVALRGGDAEEGAEVDEVRLRAGGLVAGVGLPGGDEGVGGHFGSVARCFWIGKIAVLLVVFGVLAVMRGLIAQSWRSSCEFVVLSATS